MRGLLLIAPGSPEARVNDQLRELSATLAPGLDGRYDRIACAFLAHEAPDPAAAIDREVAAGVTELICLPCVLLADSAVVRDLPRAIESARARHPGLTLRLERYLGAQPALARALLEIVP